MLGKLTFEAIPLHEPILVVTMIAVGLGGLALLAFITKLGRWGFLWKEWLTSIDHKNIGIMYIILAMVMLLRGFADALMMRSQLALASNGGTGYLPPHHYDQVFTAHGVIMIFFVAMPFIVGLMNLVVPLQIGARDVAFPMLNNLSFWMTVSGAVLINVSLFVGEFAKTGWLAFPPLSGLQYSPDVGVDYYIWALQISGVGTTLAGVNMIATILQMRAPGMTLFRMPIFVWTSLCANMLIVAAFPVLAATLAMLTADRYLDFHFFTNDAGGNAMMYINLIWIWGHPEVYILILPIFGVFSEIISTFSTKRLFGYHALVWATVCITVLSFVVWLHHFFTMGSGANVNAFFGITTMLISIPTGVKVFNWLFTMYRGRVRFETPVLWTIGFMVTFVIGGMTGVMLAVPGIAFVLHNSLFLVAHFHNVIIGGVLFGCFAGFVYWFPKATGIKLVESWGRRAFWCWLVGFYLAFMPLYVLGFLGMTRRMNHSDNPLWTPYLYVALLGALVIAAGIACQLIQIFVSLRDHKKNRDLTGDPWGGRTLEWAVASPPPFYNFAETPSVTDIDTYWDMKEQGLSPKTRDFAPIHMPNNSATGIVISGIATVFGFAMVWHIWWLAIVAFIGILVSPIIHSFTAGDGYEVQPETIERLEREHAERMKQGQPSSAELVGA